MKALSRRLPSPSMAVAVTALVIAASGSAVAATALVKGDSLIKKGSLSGNRLRNHTVTGKQINLKKLGPVPNAAFAGSAAHAISATNATNAQNAVTAQSATTAQNAVTAQNATTAATANSLPALTWTPLTLINGWVDSNAPGDTRTPAYAIDAQGIVHLRGAISNPNSSPNLTFTVLPAAVSPSARIFLATTMFGVSTGRIEIWPGGFMVAVPAGAAASNAAGLTTLDGITWAQG